MFQSENIANSTVMLRSVDSSAPPSKDPQSPTVVHHSGLVPDAGSVCNTRGTRPCHRLQKSPGHSLCVQLVQCIGELSPDGIICYLRKAHCNWIHQSK